VLTEKINGFAEEISQDEAELKKATSCLSLWLP